MNPIAKLCECGCGRPAPIATYTNRKVGIVKGQPKPFIRGHIQKVVGKCAVAGCEKPIKCLGWCQPHYKRYLRYGDPEGGGPSRVRGTLEDRFWAYVTPTSEDDDLCWPWQGSISTNGYGQMSGGTGITLTTHTVSWELHHGPIPSGLWVLHTCDFKPCVRPKHLYLGTRSDNVRDAWARGDRHRAVVPSDFI